MLKRIFFTITSVLMFVFIVGAPKHTQAQAEGARSITVIPPSFELFANPGDVINDKIRVRNDSKVATSYSIVTEDFKAVGEEGSIDLIDEGQSNTSYSLAKWVTPSVKSFSIEPGGEKEVPFSITVPKDAEPGGHYCSVLVKIGGDAQVDTGAAVSSRVGSLILLRVSGNVKEEASIESFNTTQNYYKGSPVVFDLRVKDNGNNHIKPKGTIVITDLFGQKVTELPLNGLNVLPGAVRKMSTEWKFSANLISRYTGTLVATYGQQNKPLSASTSFYVCPTWALITGCIIIFIILVMVLGRKSIKKIIHNLTK